MDTQLVKCNPNVYAWSGYCGRYVAHAFGLSALGVATALDAWYSVPQNKNQDFPQGVYFPVWFSGGGPAGHIAVIGPDGDTMYDAWSGGNQHVPGCGVLRKSSFKQFIATTKSYTYLGWSEYINKSTRVCKVEPVTTAGTPVNYDAKTTANLNVRSGPSTKFTSVKVLPQGTTTHISMESNGWAFNGSGWMSMDFLSKSVTPTKPSTSIVVGNKYKVATNAVWSNGKPAYNSVTAGGVWVLRLRSDGLLEVSGVAKGGGLSGVIDKKYLS